MTVQKLSVEEIKAVAEAAITARQKATDARATATDAGGADEDLNAAATQAEKEAADAIRKAEELSQQPAAPAPDKDKKVKKLKRKQAIIARELKDLGESGDDEEDDEEEDDLDDPDRPVTMGDLHRIEARKAAQTTAQMAEAISDPNARAAVKESLQRVVPSGDSQKDFTDAVAIANREKNSKVLEELARRGPAAHHTSGAGAPARVVDQFVPTEEEAKFMKLFGLTEADIKGARAKAAQQ